MNRNLPIAALWFVSIMLAAGLGFEYGRKVERAQFPAFTQLTVYPTPTTNGATASFQGSIMCETLDGGQYPKGGTISGVLTDPPKKTDRPYLSGGAFPLSEDGKFGCRMEDGTTTHEGLESCQKKNGMLFPDRQCVKQGTFTVCYEN